MRNFFLAIKSFFETVVENPLDAIRHYQDQNWWVANSTVWVMIVILFGFFFYWMGQLRKFDKQGSERRDVNAHSFFKKD